MSEVVICCNVVVLWDEFNKFMKVECFSNMLPFWVRLDYHFSEVYEFWSGIRQHWKFDFVEIIQWDKVFGRLVGEKFKATDGQIMLRNVFFFLKRLEISGIFLMFFILAYHRCGQWFSKLILLFEWFSIQHPESGTSCVNMSGWTEIESNMHLLLPSIEIKYKNYWWNTD